MKADKKASKEDLGETAKEEIEITTIRWGRTVIYILLVIIIGLLLWKPDLFQ